jgi:hypothetical protein
LDASFAFISDLSPLESYQSLQSLNINNTQVESLKSLEGLKKLEKIYADNTFVSEDAIDDFIDSNPTKLLIVNSEELSQWWSTLARPWKDAFSTYFEGQVSSKPEKEQLTKLILKDSLRLEDKGLNELDPLKKFSRLRFLSISGNQVSSLSPIEGLNSLSVLEAENIGLNSVKSILRLKKLQRLNLANNRISKEQFLQLNGLNNLVELNVDRGGINKDMVRSFLSENAKDCTVIYDKEGLNMWWNNLDRNWKSILKLQFPLSNIPSSKELHQLTALSSIVIIDEDIKSLLPLSQFIYVDQLIMERVGLEDLESIEAIEDVRVLSIKESPIGDIGSLSTLSNLEKLTLDFTAVSDLRPLETVQSLQHLSLKGSKIDNLKGVESLINLTHLDISSTSVRWLGKLEFLTQLEYFTCFNTRIFDFSLNKFKDEHPNCIVRFY